jgi:hypothetical protein
MFSKIERGERKAKRDHVTMLSKILNVRNEDLLLLWLADKLYEVVKDEDLGLKALAITETELKANHKSKKTK